MINKTIKIDLSVQGINDALRELERFKIELNRKTVECRKRIADEIKKYAQSGFDSSFVDIDVTGTEGRPAEVEVTVNNDNTMSVVIAKGEDAVWCEFGAGIFYNGSAGSSPNPNANKVKPKIDVSIGSYGKGHGKHKAWGYYEDGELVVTRGTPATMPMYNAYAKILKQVPRIVREVF